MIAAVEGGMIFHVIGSCLALVAVLCFIQSPGIFQHDLLSLFCWGFVFVCVCVHVISVLGEMQLLKRLLTLTCISPRCGVNSIDNSTLLLQSLF